MSRAANDPVPAVRASGVTDQELDRRGAILLGIARRHLEQTLRGQRVDEAVSDEPWLWERGATFVSLHRGEELRGCVGSLVAVRPLLDDVRDNAVAAATRDQRFAPVVFVELAELQLEVTLLSPPELLRGASELELLAQLRPGVDGVVFTWGARRATFLPQVWEMLPEPRDFLAQLKRKAGVALDFWHPAVVLERYTALRWSEAHP